MRFDPYRRPDPVETQLRRALVETRRIAEAALRERDEAVRQRDALVREQQSTLREQREALRREREEALRQRDEALRDRDAALSQPRLVELPTPTDAEARLTRLAADLANVRRVRDEQIERARLDERILGLLRLAEVHDDLVRALESNPDREGPWYQGHQAILANVRNAMRSAGAVEIGQPGERFDPNVHEAVGFGQGEPGTVTSVERSGWRLQEGPLVRPAQVRVA